MTPIPTLAAYSALALALGLWAVLLSDDMIRRRAAVRFLPWVRRRHQRDMAAWDLESETEWRRLFGAPPSDSPKEPHVH